jgi:outer membrane protein OmpA-like peptidoglycan-associated protein
MRRFSLNNAIRKKEFAMKRSMIALAGLTVAAVVQAPALAQERPVPPAVPAQINHEKACEDVTVSVYFPAYESMLSAYSMRAVNAASDRLAGCAVTEIKADVVSEEAHSDEGFAALSEARATAVLEAFSARGVRAPEIHTDISPKVDAAMALSTKAPLARRVDVILTAEPGYGL